MVTHDDLVWPGDVELEALSLQDTPWAWYEATKVTFDGAKLRGTVRPVLSDGQLHPPRGPLHVVTAVQPDSEPDSADNGLRMQILDRELAAAGIPVIAAVGTGFDGEHAEQSRAVFGLDDGAACHLGRRFGQVAVFGWSGPHWSLLACVGERRTHRLWRWEGVG